MNNIIKRKYQKYFEKFNDVITEIPQQGWIKTIREIFGMTTCQFAKKINVSQPRVINIEKNEKNLKISTMERIADCLNCKFVYAFIPRENIDKVIYNQAKKKAISILKKVNRNMELENQSVQSDEILEDIIKDLLNDNITRIWDNE
ncbi:mobile mystery protein A [bacterium]|nr:mobile mystery protein A [bacterium]